MSKMSNQPMWPIRKMLGFSAPWPGASVTPCCSRRWRSSAGASMPSGARIAVTTADGVVVGREELEPHRLDAGARRPAEADVPLERGVEAVVEDHPERDVEAADQRDGRRERGVEDLLRLPRRAPVEVEGARRRQRRPRGGRRPRPSRGPGGHISAFCEPERTTSIAPGVRLERHGAERGDRVDDEGRVADRGLDRLDVGDDAGRGLGLGAEDDRPRPLSRAAAPISAGSGTSPHS